MNDICPRCGLDLDTLGRWKDFIHLDKSRSRSWCIEPMSDEEIWGPEGAILIRETIKDLAKDMHRKLKKQLKHLKYT